MDSKASLLQYSLMENQENLGEGRDKESVPTPQENWPDVKFSQG